MSLFRSVRNESVSVFLYLFSIDLLQTKMYGPSSLYQSVLASQVIISDILKFLHLMQSNCMEKLALLLIHALKRAIRSFDAQRTVDGAEEQLNFVTLFN